jgi:hypothetical protein
MASRFPREAPSGFINLAERGLDFRLVPYKGYQHALEILQEHIPFVKRYVESGQISSMLSRMVLFGHGQVQIGSKLVDVLNAFDFDKKENDKKPLLDLLKKTFLPILEKMKEVTPSISDEVDEFLRRYTKKNLSEIIDYLENLCSGAQSGSAAAASVGSDSESDE